MGTLSFSDLEITSTGHTSAWVLGRWQLDDAQGKKLSGGIFTLVCRKFGDQWLIIHDHTSSDPEPK